MIGEIGRRRLTRSGRGFSSNEQTPLVSGTVKLRNELRETAYQFDNERDRKSTVGHGAQHQPDLSP